MDKKKKLLLYNQFLSGGSSQTMVDQINSYRTRDNGVYIFNYSNTTKFFRVFAPFNDKYAQFWTVNKENSATSDYYEFAGPQGVAEYYEIQAPTSRTGSWSNFGTSGSSYASVVGATLSFTFTGIGFKIRHGSDNRGGVFRFVITRVSDSVVISTIDVSTWNVAAFANRNTLVTDTLNYDTYSVIATFTGDDPLHAPSGGVSRGWLCTNYTATNINLYDRPIWVLGSPTPNFCYPPGTDIINSGTSSNKHTYSIGSHREYAFQSRKVGSGTTLTDGWVPLHGNVGNATTFANLTTDRVLQFDNSGTNLITSLSGVYSLGITGTELTLYQKFIGYNPNGSSADQLFDITQTWTWTSEGLKVNTRIEVLADLDPTGNTSYVSMLDAPIQAAGEGFQYIVMDSGDELITSGVTPTTVYYTKAQLESGIYNGGTISINKTGTDLEKSFVQGQQIRNPIPLGKFSKDYNQSLLTWPDGTRRKMYYTVVNDKPVLAGEVWEWETDWVMGIVPDAYNVLT